MQYAPPELYATREAQQDKHILSHCNMAKISGIMSQLGQLSTFASEVFFRINAKIDSISVRLSFSLSLSRHTHTNPHTHTETIQQRSTKTTKSSKSRSSTYSKTDSELSRFGGFSR